MMKERGITLISLVITIVIILILATITINMLTGENGIIKNTGKAKEATEIANEKEIVQRAIVNAIVKNKYGDLKQDDVEKQLNEEQEGRTEVTDVGDEFEILFKESNRYYTVDKDGNISEEQIATKIENAGDITKGGILDGSKEKPYKIDCIEDLIEWSNNYFKYINSNIELGRNLNFKSKFSYANSTSTEYGDLNEDGNIESVSEELCKGKGYTPITQFGGFLNGNNRKISNIYINNEKLSRVGFISEAQYGIIIKNLTISGEIRSTGNHTGGFIGCISNTKSEENENGKIENCHNYANIYGNAYSGGIVGYINQNAKLDTIANCSNFGKIKNTIRDDYAGGIVANTDSSNLKIERCYNAGEVDGSGITGNNRSIINNCYNKGKTKCGLVGSNQNEINNCYNIGICTEKCIIRNSNYTLSHIYNCFSEIDFADKIALQYGSIDDKSKIFKRGYMQTSDFFNYLNKDDIWKQDTAKINNGYPIFKWQQNF